MKVIIICVGDLIHCPPAISVIQGLVTLGYNVSVCTNKFDKQYNEIELFNKKNINFEFIGDKFNPKKNKFAKFIDMFKIRKDIWKFLDSTYNSESLIWIVSGGSVKYLGKKILKRNYILHLLELTEELYYLESKHALKISRKYINNAKSIIECEYTRAHITKAWWQLNNLPFILPNKPFYSNKINKNSTINSNDYVKNIISNLMNKKIILYQGNISKERPLRPFLDAVEDLGEDYVFVAMINGSNPFPEYNGRQFYHIPFVAPPYHLEVTSHAYIGILSYTPIKNDYSILNTLYCAPNKIWEYSMFGVPMISNDLPAMKSQFLEYKNGKCFSSFSKDEIKNTINDIALNYAEYSKNSNIFFNSLDLTAEIEKIMNYSIKEIRGE